jgi:fibronectin type 3 domain-containing protein
VTAAIHTAAAIDTPTNLVSCAGDLSIVLHWDQSTDPTLAGYNVYRSASSNGPFTVQNTSLLTSAGFCDLHVSDGQTNFYQVTAVDTSTNESPPSATLACGRQSLCER